MQQRYYDPVAGRFLSIDPVLTDANTGSSFNRYVYANNSPYKYLDPDGRNPLAIEAGIWGTFACGPVFGIAAAGGALVGGTYVAAKFANWLESRSGPKRNDATATSNSGGQKGGSQAGGKAPSLSDKLVGDQRDPRAVGNKSGDKHTSGTLTPENGGTGDFKRDLGTLAGPTRPAGVGDSAPPGALIGENGVFGRPENKSGGASIDIPAKGDKPHETLHYPPSD
jgi:filamentous hemagglutinin